MFLIKGIDILLRDYSYNMFTLNDELILEKTKFYIKIPTILLLVITIIVYTIIFIASKISSRKINKISPIEAIKNSNSIKVKANNLKPPKMIETIFKEEGIIGYKNIKRDKVRYKTIVISVTTSIILFLTISGIAKYFYEAGFQGTLMQMNQDAKYQFSIYDENKKDELIEYLENNNLINDYYMFERQHGKLKLEPQKMTKEMKKVVDKLFQTAEDGAIYVNVAIEYYYDEAYENILKNVGIKELKDDEVIIIDTIQEKTKFGNKIKMTNFNIGDSYTVEIEGKNKTFKIVRNSRKLWGIWRARRNYTISSNNTSSK